MFKHEFKQIKDILMTIADNVIALQAQETANANALAAIQTQLATLIANPPTDTSALKAQLTQIQTDLGDTSAAVSATTVAAAAAPTTTITPTTSAGS